MRAIEASSCEVKFPQPAPAAGAVIDPSPDDPEKPDRPSRALADA
jgi:hypothetical protein